MSEFHCLVVEIDKVGKHPNADNLSITNIHGGYPCIFRTGDFNQANLAAYIPVDALVPLDREEFKFLFNPDKPKQYSRIRAKQLRGIFSMGLLVKAPPNTKPGDNIQEYFGIKKYEPPIDTAQFSGENEKDPGYLHKYTDIEGYRKYKYVLQDKEFVLISEKLHGANFRAIYKDNRLWVGSHHCIKKENDKNIYWQIAKRYNLEEKLKQYPNTIIYGEIYGHVQKNFHYDVLTRGLPKLRLFDMKSLELMRYLDYMEFSSIATELDLETVPELYMGPWNSQLSELANGVSVLGSHTIREGIVIKPVIERWDQEIGRVILKLPGEEYLLDKNS